VSDHAATRADEARVTIIMPFLNAERFMGEAVESVLAQTYSAWELLMVDDGSTDGSTAMARRYAERHPGKIRWLEHPGHRNRGASAARNLGLREAAGTYIALLDADDVWFPTTLERQVAWLRSRPEAAMVYGKTQHWYSWAGDRYWYDWPGKPRASQRDHVRDLGVPSGVVVAPPILLTLYLRRRAAVPATCSLLARREAVEASGGFEEEFRDQFTDQVFFAKMILAAPVLVVDECLSRYRQHPDSACYRTKREGRVREARLRYLSWLAGYLALRRIEDPDLAAALRHEIWLYRHPRWLAATERARALVQRLERTWERYVMPRRRRAATADVSSLRASGPPAD
jgi:glycosyltransferase involved in cell wall biosynthesis